MIQSFPKTHIAAAVAISLVVGTALALSPSADVEANRIIVPLEIEHPSAVPIQAGLFNSESSTVANPTASAESLLSDLLSDTAPAVSGPSATAPAIEDPAPAAPEIRWSEFAVASGDTLSGLFRKAGFNDGTMLSVINGSGEASKLQRLYAGESISFATNADDELVAVRLERSRLESLLIEKGDEGFRGETVLREPEVRAAHAAGEIEGSLYLAGKQAGLTDRTTMEMAGIFGWDIDFVYDVRRGDSFEVIYEELYLDDEKIDTGKVLAVRFNNRGRELTALYYSDSEGNSDYYTPDGKNMRKAFLRAPIDARVSSPFNLQRRHPILDVVRPHQGTDYAAATGTPIKAAGDGRVSFAGWQGGYGRTVILQHGDNITTLYAHMSKLGNGIAQGQRVRQGETIGYVGATGMATGPHLHYEFRVNGVARNSRTVQLPDANPIPQSEMARFQAHTGQLVASLNSAEGEIRQLALAEGDE